MFPGSASGVAVDSKNKVSSLSVAEIVTLDSVLFVIP